MVPFRVSLPYLVLIAGGILFSLGTFAAPEARSIYGIHDSTPDPSEYLNHVKAGGAGGWVTATVAVGHNPSDTSSQSFSSLANAGHTVVCRLNNGYFPDGTIPLSTEYDNFARRCSNFVINSSGCNIWVIGNELNLQGEWPFTGTNFSYVSPQQYATCFRKVYNAIKAARPNDRVLPAPPSPFAGPYGAGALSYNSIAYPADGVPINWVTYLNQMLTAIAGSGGIDGIALHITSRGYAFADIHSASRVNAGGQSLSFSFDVYKDWVEKGIPPSLYHLPLYATECNGYYYWKGGHPENSAKHYETDFMQEIYAEINRYNLHALGAGKPIFRCVNMYRWCDGCDGWNIDGGSNPYKAQILSDLDSAVAQNYRWPDGTENRTNIVSAGALWRYLDNGSDQGTNWRGTNFSDGAWSQGLAQLGYGDGDEKTLVGYGGVDTNKYITTWFRRAFNVPDAGFYTNLMLRVLRDDGVIVYLNGNEVFRDNLPGGTINYRTQALNAVTGGEESTNFISTNLNSSMLRMGTNFLAVEIHQNTNNSSDISFDLELIGRGNSPPSVSILQSAVGAVFGAPTNLTIAASATDDYAVTRLDWLINGVRIAQQSNPPFLLTLSNLSPGSYTFTAVAYDGVLAKTSVPVTLTLHQALITAGSVWKYRDNGSDQGTAWRGTNFNDNSWPSGVAQLGYGDGDERTEVCCSNAPVKFITTYFRRAFMVTDASPYTNLLVRAVRDDGIVAYLNGTEIFRDNMPTGTVTYATLASSSVSSSDETTNFHAGVTNALALRTGTNVLAAEIHQIATDSSDISFDLELLGVAPLPPASLRIARSFNNALLSWPAGAGDVVLQSAFTVGSPANWSDASVSITYSNGEFHAALPFVEVQQFFRLRFR